MRTKCVVAAENKSYCKLIPKRKFKSNQFIRNVSFPLLKECVSEGKRRGGKEGEGGKEIFKFTWQMSLHRLNVHFCLFEVEFSRLRTPVRLLDGEPWIEDVRQSQTKNSENVHRAGESERTDEIAKRSRDPLFKNANATNNLPGKRWGRNATFHN